MAMWYERLQQITLDALNRTIAFTVSVEIGVPQWQ